MYRSHEERMADWHALAHQVGVEDIGRFEPKKSRHSNRKYVTPEWMFDNRLYTFLSDCFPKAKAQSKIARGVLQNHRKNHDYQFWRAALWLQILFLWFRMGRTEKRTAAAITQSRAAWLTRNNYRTDERNIKKIDISPTQVAKFVEHIKNVAAGWNPYGKTRAERLRNCPRQNKSPRVDVVESLVRQQCSDEFRERAAKYGIPLPPEHRRGRPRKTLPAQIDTETK